MNPHTDQLVTDWDVLQTYDQYPFEEIEARLETVREYLLDAPRPVVATALMLSDTNAIISASTHVDAHERGTISVWNEIQSGVTTRDELASALDSRTPDGSSAVMYYNNKAKYITSNLAEVDYVDHARLFQEERFRELQQRLARNVTGLGMQKAGFSLANLGAVECCCIDGVLIRNLGLDPRPFRTSVVERYYEQVDELKALTPQAAEQLPTYIWQWALWSTIRKDGFTPHDPWFALLDDVLPIDVFSPGKIRPASESKRQSAADAG